MSLEAGMFLLSLCMVVWDIVGSLVASA